MLFRSEVLTVPSTHTSASTSITQNATYTVQAGDTLWGIAQNHNTTIATLTALNHIENPSLIYPGQILILPN